MLGKQKNQTALRNIAGAVIDFENGPETGAALELTGFFLMLGAEGHCLEVEA